MCNAAWMVSNSLINTVEHLELQRVAIYMFFKSTVMHCGTKNVRGIKHGMSFLKTRNYFAFIDVALRKPPDLALIMA